MSEFLGGDYDFDLDTIIDADDTPVIETSKEEDIKEPKDKKTEDTPKEEDTRLDIDEEGNDITADVTKEGEEKEETEEGTDDLESSSSDNITAYASALYDEGAFPDIDKEEIEKVKNVNDLIALNRKQIEANELRDLSPEQREALTSFRNGFSVEDFKVMKRDELHYDSIKDDDLIDDDVSKNIVTDYLRMTNTDESVIKDLLESYEVDSKLTDKAKVYLPKIKDAIKARNAQTIQNAETQKQDAIRNIKSGLESTKQIFKEIPLSEKEKGELYSQMTTPVQVMEDGTQLDYVMQKRQEDPMGFMIKLHYYAAKGLFDKEPNTEFLQAKERTKALSKLEEKLSKGNSSTRVTGSRKATGSDSFEFDEVPDVKFNF
jgi:hypothetical protein